ncbi:DNA methyltransferase [Vibrio sp. 10N.222.54.F6]|uniref:DNA methyltransferase n=1 Tax=unclassified Vibrio TaxID=2614977 RepID=UPI000C85B017|nr:DNA methyltransferase [Vibrio sp. 10N.261.51.A7]PML73176.1 DNA methyltransferase [Vibrio sp. 10N.261.51.A7]
MNSVQIEENVKDLVQNISNQSVSRNDFVYELLLAYGHRKSVVSRVKSGERNLSKNSGEVILKRHLYFKPCTTNLFAEIDELKNSKTTSSNKIRFVVVTDFNQLIAVDTKTQDTLDIELNQLSKHFDFFLPWAGMEKMVYRGENPADVKAAEKMADFFDHIKELNYPPNASKEQLHDLVVFLNRLLFCFFAEDTKIFGDNQFTNLLNQHTSEDGSDVATTFQRLFEVLNTAGHQRNDLPQYLSRFPYVNGGLFKKELVIPAFDAKARRMLLDSGQLDWADINPDIFGSMIQGVADPDTRSKMGMHYTSVTNIMKVIEPLFLNDFYDEFEKSTDNINKLRKLQVRLSRIKIFDPACGSGNFLIIAYKEIRLLEIEILKRIRELEGESDSGAMGLFDESHSSIRLDQFYGIELDDFAHEMAILSLWLVEHQMNMVFETEFGYTAPTLPLKQSGRILAGNAAVIEWEQVCPTSHDDEVYILGNPPYLGARNQTKTQKEDMRSVLSIVKGVNSLDYIALWFYKASLFITGKNAKCSFVTTNSIVQGEHVPLLWPHILNDNIEIDFAYDSFKWTNNAKQKAAVICVIIGLRNTSTSKKYLFHNVHQSEAKNISPYLTDSETVFIAKRSKPLSKIPKMEYGNQPIEGGFLKLEDKEKVDLETNYPESKPYIRQLIGGSEFLKGQTRWCLWIEDEDLEIAQKIPPIKSRIESVKEFRESGGEVARSLVNRSHQFRYRHTAREMMMIMPCTSSERREYIPVGLLSADNITLHSVQVLYDPEPYIFGILSSKMHLTWTLATSGRLKSDIRYSSALSYNTFPIPELSASEKELVVDAAFNVLDIRESYPELSISELYDPDNMPMDLREAHISLDKTVDSLYSKTAFDNNDQRLSCLIAHYFKKIKEN